MPKFSEDDLRAMSIHSGQPLAEVRANAALRGAEVPEDPDIARQTLEDIASPLETAAPIDMSTALPPGQRVLQSAENAARSVGSALAGSREHFRTKSPEEIATAEAARTDIGPAVGSRESLTPATEGEVFDGEGVTANLTTPGAQRVVTSGVPARAAASVGKKFAPAQEAAAEATRLARDEAVVASVDTDMAVHNVAEAGIEQQAVAESEAAETQKITGVARRENEDTAREVEDNLRRVQEHTLKTNEEISRLTRDADTMGANIGDSRSRRKKRVARVGIALDQLGRTIALAFSGQQLPGKTVAETVSDSIDRDIANQRAIIDSKRTSAAAKQTQLSQFSKSFGGDAIAQGEFLAALNKAQAAEDIRQAARNHQGGRLAAEAEKEAAKLDVQVKQHRESAKERGIQAGVAASRKLDADRAKFEATVAAKGRGGGRRGPLRVSGSLTAIPGQEDIVRDLSPAEKKSLRGLAGQVKRFQLLANSQKKLRAQAGALGGEVMPTELKAKLDENQSGMVTILRDLDKTGVPSVFEIEAAEKRVPGSDFRAGGGQFQLDALLSNVVEGSSAFFSESGLQFSTGGGGGGNARSRLKPVQ